MEIASSPGPFRGASQKGPGDEANVEKEPGLETKRPRPFFVVHSYSLFATLPPIHSTA